MHSLVNMHISLQITSITPHGVHGVTAVKRVEREEHVLVLATA